MSVAAVFLLAVFSAVSASGRFELQLLSSSAGPLSLCLSPYRRSLAHSSDCSIASVHVTSPRVSIPLHVIPADFNIVLRSGASVVGASQVSMSAGDGWTDMQFGAVVFRMRFVCDDEFIGSACRIRVPSFLMPVYTSVTTADSSNTLLIACIVVLALLLLVVSAVLALVLARRPANNTTSLVIGRKKGGAADSFPCRYSSHLSQPVSLDAESLYAEII